MSQQQRPNTLGGKNTTLVQHAHEVTSTAQKWHSVTPGYYIPRVVILFRLTSIVGCYTYEPIHVLNPTITDLELECNQLLNQLEQLRNLEQRPSH